MTSDIDDEYYEQDDRHMGFAQDYNRPGHQQMRLGPFQRFEQRHDQHVVGDSQHDLAALNGFLGDDWRTEVAHAKVAYGFSSGNDGLPQSQTTGQGYEHPSYNQFDENQIEQQVDQDIDQEEDQIPTPSRSKTIPPTRTEGDVRGARNLDHLDANRKPASPRFQPRATTSDQAKVVAFERNLKQPVTRARQQVSPLLDTRRLPVQTKVTSKSTSMSSISSEEAQPLANQPTPPVQLQNQKRSRDSLEYDSPILKSMTFAQLSAVPFTTDPHVPPPDPVLDSHGNLMTLPAKLSNLPKMSLDAQRSLFRSQTDAEWEETGTWFMDKIAEDMKKLIDVRMERRKTALKYEMEVKRRQKMVEVKSEDVQGELEELKKGGGVLIGGRSVSVLGTPRKG